MAENEDNSSAYKNRGYSKTSQIVIQNEVKDLFYKFNSLREETHKEFSTIINGHSESISKGIDDLVEEELQAQVSIIAHERNVLLETVANLNSEIRKLSAPLKHVLPEDKENETDNHVTQDVGDSEEVTSDTEQHSEERGTIAREIGDDEESGDYGMNIEDQTGNHGDKYSLNYQSQSINIESSENVSSPEDSVCNECNFAFSTGENLKIHLENYHSDLKKSGDRLVTEDQLSKPISNFGSVRTIKSPGQEKTKKKYKCKECSYQFFEKRLLKRHIDTVHKNIRNHVCEECGNAYHTKFKLKQHINCFHNNIRNFKCHECDNAYPTKYTMTRHMNSVHKMGEKMFKCDLCPYTTFVKVLLKPHIEGVHKKIKKHFCEECEYGTYKKSALDYHMISAHGKGDKKFKCKKCSYSSATKYHLVQHNDAVHDKIKKNICPKCDYAASAKRNLKRHMESVHRGGDKK